MEFRDYLLLARRQWWVMVISGLLAAAAAILFVQLTTPQYVATIKLFVSLGRTDDAAAVYQAGAFTQQRAKSYADLLGSRRICADVVRDLGLRMSPEALQSRVRTEVVPDTVMLKAMVGDPSPARAEQIANALGRRLRVLVNDLERAGKAGSAPVKVTLVDPADLPRTPASPRPVRDVLSALCAGLLLGFGFTVARERLDRSVKSSEKLTELAGAPTLGVITHDPKAGSLPLVVHIGSYAPRSEAFRQLRTSLQFIDVGASVKRIVMTSCRPGEGKSTTLSNLAITLAQAGQRVVVVDADLRRPRLSDYLGIEGAAGLTDVLIGRAELEEVLQPWGDLPMRVLPSGPTPPNPSELLGSARMEELIQRLEPFADIVLFDVPPLLPVTDAVVLTRLCDGALLVARHGSTHEEQIRRAVAMLADVDARLLGAVLNMVPPKGAEAYNSGYGYHEENASPVPEDATRLTGAGARDGTVNRRG